MREDPLRTGVTKRNAGAHDGFGVVPADKIDDDVSLLSAQLSTFVGGRAVCEIRRRRAAHKDRVNCCEDSALAQRADESS